MWRRFLGIAVLPAFILAGADARAFEVHTPEFTVEIPGEQWRQVPLARGATPWRYTRSLGEVHTLFVALSWIPLDDQEDGPPPDEARVAEDIMAEAQRRAKVPGRKLLNWSRSEEPGLAQGAGCWRYASDFRVAAGTGDKIEYRSRGFICRMPAAGEGLAWLRYDELKSPEESWAPGYEAAALELRESLRPSE